MTKEMIHLLEEIKDVLWSTLYIEWDRFTNVFLTDKTFEDWRSTQEEYKLIVKIDEKLTNEDD